MKAKPKSPPMEIVPFHEAVIEEHSVKLTNGLIQPFKDGRSVEVWKKLNEEGLIVRIFRPTDDGKMSKLVFGLSSEAAGGLAYLLAKQLQTITE